MDKAIISIINRINDKSRFNLYKTRLKEIANTLKSYDYNFNILKLIVCFASYPDIIYFFHENGINFFKKDKRNKNLLFYTLCIRNHVSTNALIKIGIPIQNKFLDLYIECSFYRSIFPFYSEINKKNIYNLDLVLNLIYSFGIDLIYIQSKITEPLCKIYYESFVKNYKTEIDYNLKCYKLWNRRKNLAFIINDKHLSIKYPSIFNDRIGVTNIIKSYL